MRAAISAEGKRPGCMNAQPGPSAPSERADVLGLKSRSRANRLGAGRFSARPGVSGYSDRETAYDQDADHHHDPEQDHGDNDLSRRQATLTPSYLLIFHYAPPILTA
jgi:hypothetical protein